MKIKSIFLLLLMQFLSSCVSFESVSTVGKLGATLTDDKSLNENTIFLCESMQAIQKDIVFNCDKYEKDVKSLNAGIDIMASYAKTLALAIKDSDIKSADAIEQTVKSLNGANWTGANENQVAGLKAIASGLQSLLVNSAKRKVLGKTISQLNPSVQSVCTGMIKIIDNQKKMYLTYDLLFKNRVEKNQDFRKVVDSTGKFSSKEFVTYNDSDKATVAFARKLIKDELDKLDQSAKIFEAFGKGHQVLSDKRPLIGTKSDQKVLNSVIDALKDIFDGIEKFKKPVTSS